MVSSFRKSYIQHPQKLDIWVRIVGENVIGPLCITDFLTVEAYLNMFRNIQQPGASTYFHRLVQYFSIPGRWIGRKGATEWSKRTPDLSSNNLFLCDYLKVIYETAALNL